MTRRKRLEETLVQDPKLKGLVGHLLRLGHLKAQRLFLEEVGRKGLTSLQVGILLAVDETPDIEHRALSAQLRATKPIMTTALKPLLSQRLVEQSTSSADGRVSTYTLTKIGRTRLDQFRPALVAAENGLVGNLEPDELEELKSLLRKCVKNDR